MSNLNPMPMGLTKSLTREHAAYLAQIRAAVNSKADNESGISGTYTFSGGSPGDVASMTFVNGILTAVTEVL